MHISARDGTMRIAKLSSNDLEPSAKGDERERCSSNKGARWIPAPFFDVHRLLLDIRGTTES